MTKFFFFTPLFYCRFWIQDPGWVNIGIQDKHPGSATLLLSSVVFRIRIRIDQYWFSQRSVTHTADWHFKLYLFFLIVFRIWIRMDPH
jgi:hypothetical protein